MKKDEYHFNWNKILLEKEKGNRQVFIGKGYYDDLDKNQYPLVFVKDHHIVKGKTVYRINRFGTLKDPNFFYVALNFYENIKFLWLQKKLWIQNKDSIMWLINIVVAALAITASF